nr:uncharacterized protein LOC109412442 [Aedes albopictus]XP_019561935.1 uncharacterized protein LOC109430334 [Aedes albopictus]
MKVQFCMFLLTASLVLVIGDICNIRLGRRETGDFQMYTLHATKGPFSEAQNLSLTFDYQVSPVDTVEVTFVEVNTNLQNQCVATMPVTNFSREFQITITTEEPVTAFYGSATIYGIRRF